MKWHFKSFSVIIQSIQFQYTNSFIYLLRKKQYQLNSSTDIWNELLPNHNQIFSFLIFMQI